jgi:hypothetical protein
VFILTHRPRDPVEMQGGTTHHFVTDGIESALEQAREAAGDWRWSSPTGYDADRPPATPVSRG